MVDWNKLAWHLKFFVLQKLNWSVVLLLLTLKFLIAYIATLYLCLFMHRRY